MYLVSSNSRTLTFVILALFISLSACQTNTSQNTQTPTQLSENVITLAAVGDIACNKVQRLRYPCVDAEVAELIESKNPDHVLLLGDIQYQEATTRELQENFAVSWADLLDRSIPVPGNHEYRTEGARDYFKFFDKYPKRGYFTVKLNETWSVLAINTNEDCKIVRCDKGSKQYKWIEKRLTDLRCVIAISHHPRFSTGEEHGSNLYMKDVYKLLRKNNVSVLLSGHDHHYERFNSKVVQYVVGTGGKDLRNASGSVNSVKIDDKFGALLITVDSKRLETEFVDLDGVRHDQQSVRCSK